MTNYLFKNRKDVESRCELQFSQQEGIDQFMYEEAQRYLDKIDVSRLEVAQEIHRKLGLKGTATGLIVDDHGCYTGLTYEE